MGDVIDPGRRDAAAVERIYERAASLTAGQAEVLELITAAELFTLNAVSRSPVDEDAWSWWEGMSEADRFTRSVKALEFLVHKKLLDPLPPGMPEGPGDDVSGRVRPPLALIVAGRARPAFIALRREGADDQPGALRMYGIADEHDRLRAVLVEERAAKSAGGLGAAFYYALCSRDGCTAALAGWAARPAAPYGVRRRRRPRVVDVYRAGSGAASDRIEVLGEPEGLTVTLQRSGERVPPVRTDEAGLRRLVDEALPVGPA